MGLRADEFWDMTWLEYDCAVHAYRTKLAQNFEPTRELMTMIYNMMSEKGDKKNSTELMPLFTDPVITSAVANNGETDEEFMARMAANNFFQSPTKE